MKRILEIDKFLGQKLRQKRLERGLSQNQLGNKVGITFQQIQKYEKGVNRISASRMHQITKVLNTTINYFFKGFEKGVETESITKEEATLIKMTSEVMRILRGVKDNAKRKNLICIFRDMVNNITR